MTSRRIDHAGITDRYGATPKEAAAWPRLVNFPVADEDGLWDVDRVDAWVQAMRPHYWPPKSEVTAAVKAPRARARKPAAAAAPATESRPEIAKRFGMTPAAVAAWTKCREKRDSDGNVVTTAFPDPARNGQWETKAVDEWVRTHRPRVWAAYTQGEPQYVKPLPAGHPRDLLGISEYGIIRGNALSGKPAQRRTMQAYLLRKQIAAPDRLPGDRKRPEVFEPMWYRETIYREIHRRVTKGGSEKERTPPKK